MLYFENDFQIEGGKMSKKNEYKTKQSEIVLEFLREKTGEHLTVNDIYEHLQKQGLSIGLTTVYRQLEKLVSQGVVKKYILDLNTPACFEYIPSDCAKSHEPCFHLKCKICDKLIHLKCEELSEMEDHLMKEHKFMLDSQRTVLYGVCENCRKKLGEKNEKK